MSTLPTKQKHVKLYAGIDLGLERNVVQVIDDQGRKVAKFEFGHSRAGYERLEEQLSRLEAKYGTEKIAVGMEPTNYFWKLVATDLEQRQRAYHLVNAYTVKKHREGDQLDRSKDDNRDGRQIAELVRMGKYTHSQLLNGTYAELREAANHYHRLLKDVGRQKILLRMLVGQVFPEATQVLHNLDSQVGQAVLRRHASAHQIRQMRWEDFAQAVRQDFHGKRLAVRQVQQLYHLAATSVGLQVGCVGLQAQICDHLDTLQLLKHQLARACTRLLELFAQFPQVQVWTTIPGISGLVAALLLAEIGDPAHYQSPGQWVKLAGIQPTVNASGTFSASKTPMSKKGRVHLRTLLFFASLRLIRLAAPVHRRYQQLQSRSVNPLAKKQAVGVVMNRLLHVLWALYQHQTSFAPARFS